MADESKAPDASETSGASESSGASEASDKLLGLDVDDKYIREEVVKWGVSPTQCTQYTHNDTRFYMYIDRSRDLPPDETIYENIHGRAIKNGPYGIYTWIWFLNDKGDFRFQSVHVESPSELGTKHISMLIRSIREIKTLIYAGELHRERLADGHDAYTMNFYSGSTGMEYLADQHRIAYELIPSLRIHLNLPDTDQLQFSEESFNIAEIPTDPSVLRKLERNGYHLLFFEEPKQCIDYKTFIIRHLAEKLELSRLRSELMKADKYNAKIWMKQIEATHTRAKLPMPFANSLAELDSKTIPKT